MLKIAHSQPPSPAKLHGPLLMPPHIPQAPWEAGGLHLWQGSRLCIFSGISYLETYLESVQRITERALVLFC